MSLPSISTKKVDPTAFARLPVNLTDSDAVNTVPREPKASGLRPPLSQSPKFQEILNIHHKERKEHEERVKEVDALRCENGNLKQKVEDLQQEVAYMSAKAATASPPAKKVETRDQEVDATEGNLTEQLEQLHEHLRELRTEKKRTKELVLQQEDALWALRGACSDAKTADCMALYLSAMQAVQDQ